MTAPEITRSYARFHGAVRAAKVLLGRPMTFAEKVLYAHRFDQPPAHVLARGTDFAAFRPDRVAMQDATAQMALLQFMNAGRTRSAVPATIHCDHLIVAQAGVGPDLAEARVVNAEVYGFLQRAADKYGLGFWAPGAGIIHQVVLENYAFPGGLLIGTDSHTPNAGGLGMLGVGVGGSDAVDAMTGMEWELLTPRLIGVVLTGRLSGWASAKDVILHLAGKLTVKGGTNAIIEYLGPGAATLSATGKATICNMGAEVGATSSLFGYDDAMADYLRATGRSDVADVAAAIRDDLVADPEVEAHPLDFFDEVVEIDLSTLEPHVNGPFTPDAATPVSQLAAKARDAGWPVAIESALIGSCTNSSYQDLARAASLARQALAAGLRLACPLFLNPGSARIETTGERDELLAPLRDLGVILLADACGPCIGQWRRVTDDNTRPNSVVTSFNRNFAGRLDGNPSTHAFVASPEMVLAFALAGRLDVNPLTDVLITPEGRAVHLAPPAGPDLPAGGFVHDVSGYVAPEFHDDPITVDPASQRLALLAPFPAWDGRPITGAPLLIKVAGKCTTDHISPAGPWLAYRGHLARISDNLLSGAVNAFTGEAGRTRDPATNKSCVPVARAARDAQGAGLTTVIVAGDNYGEGSSREHAAMEPRYLGVGVVLARSFARIHETNLKKQGMLALTFADPADYDRILEDDRFDLPDLPGFAPGRPLTVGLVHADGSRETIVARHTYTSAQIAWFRAGSALNLMSQQQPHEENA
ncbi:MAG: aconitate hydratase [Actinomycetia bacterium]|nr:aconitate hydratase [Actinomycetes bacterium]